MRKRGLSIAVSTLIIAIVFSLPAAAGARPYTYNHLGEPVESPSPATVDFRIDGREAGCGEWNQPEDIALGPDGRLYVADTGNNRVVALENNRAVQVYTSYRWLAAVVDEETGELTGEQAEQDIAFNNPTGLYVTDRGELYVADKGNARVIILDAATGKSLRSIETPVSELLKEQFQFKPHKVCADTAGRAFVLVSGVYDGLMEFNRNGEFVGFSGANKVTPNLLEYFWKSISSADDSSAFVSFIPTEFDNLDMDPDGFVYTVTGTGINAYNPAQSSPVRRQTESGINILRNSYLHGKPIGDLAYNNASGTGSTQKGPSYLLDIAVLPSGAYYCLDRTRGRVFSYDFESNMLFVFGGLGSGEGMFLDPAAIEAEDDRVFVLDKKTGAVTGFVLSDYGKLILQAEDYYYQGEYEASGNTWREVLKKNSNYDLAYTGLGKVQIRQGDYRGAMENLKLGGDKEYYSVAFQYYRDDLLSRNLHWALLALFACIALAVVLIKVALPRLRRAEALNRFETWQGFRYGFHILIHPFDGFWDMKHEKRGNVKSSLLILLLTFITMSLRSQYSGFLFTSQGGSYSLFGTLLTLIVPVGLFIVSNWCVTTLFNGDGRPQDILAVTGYAMLPYVLINLPLTLVSNFLTLQEGTLVSVLSVFSLIWCGLLLFFGILTVHQYSLKQTILTSLATLVGIATIVFLFVLLINLLQQLLLFCMSIYNEIIFSI